MGAGAGGGGGGGGGRGDGAPAPVHASPPTLPPTHPNPPTRTCSTQRAHWARMRWRSVVKCPIVTASNPGRGRRSWSTIAYLMVASHSSAWGRSGWGGWLGRKPGGGGGGGPRSARPSTAPPTRPPAHSPTRIVLEAGAGALCVTPDRVVGWLIKVGVCMGRGVCACVCVLGGGEGAWEGQGGRLQFQRARASSTPPTHLTTPPPPATKIMPCSDSSTWKSEERPGCHFSAASPPCQVPSSERHTLPSARGRVCGVGGGGEGECCMTTGAQE